METMAFPRRPIPKVAKVKQYLPTDHIPNVRKETRQRLLDAGLRAKIQPGNLF